MSKQIFRAVLGAAVIIGITALCAGCPTGGGGGGGGDPSNPGTTNTGTSTDTWSSKPPSLSQLNGIWKGPYNNGTRTVQAPSYGNIQETSWGNFTLTINAGAKTLTILQTGTQTYSGENVAGYWAELKKSLFSSPEYKYTFDEPNHSFTYSYNKTQSFTDAELADSFSSGYFQINQDGKKIKMGGTNTSGDVILTKQ